MNTGQIATGRTNSAGSEGVGRAFLAVGMLALALIWGQAPAALAAPNDPFMDRDAEGPSFPRLVVSSSTYRAGAHPDLTIEVHKLANHCSDPADPTGETWTDEDCAIEDLYYEQSLKRMTVSFPPGLIGDPNAAPYCEAGRRVRSATSRQLEWYCQNSAAYPVGEVAVLVTGCSRDEEEGTAACQGGAEEILGPDGRLYRGRYGFFSGKPGVFLHQWPVYMERPRPGEQGHLVAFINDGGIRADISIKVRESDLGMDSVADWIPDTEWFCGLGDEDWCPPPPDYPPQPEEVTSGDLSGRAVATQVSDMMFTLFGNTGAERDHPLLTNPTFCKPQSINAEFEGYLLNPLVDPTPAGLIYLQGVGGGKVRTASAPYQATGCDQVPYSPKLSMTFDNLGPNQAPALDATVSQGPGEATTGEATVTFPSGFKVNMDNTAEHCSEENLKAKTCPEESRIGTVTATSPLLPIGEELKGNVYLAGLTGDSIKVEAQLHGFVDFDIRAEGMVGGDLKIENVFENLPAVPVSEFKLHLEGGEKGLLRTPRTCGPQTIRSTFVSHSGKRVNQDIPIYIGGCGEPELEVELSPRRPNRLSELELSVLGRGHKIRSVRFGIARQLRWGYKKRKSTAKKSARKGKRKKRTPSAGLVTLTTTSGEISTRLKAKQTKRGSVRLMPYRSTGLKGAKSALSTFRGSLFRTKKRQSKLAKRKKAKRKGKRRKRRAVLRQADLKLLGLPKDGATDIDMTLKGRARGFFIRTRKGCANPLHFVAIVTTVEGKRFAMSDEIRIKGAGCGGRLYRRGSHRAGGRR